MAHRQPLEDIVFISNFAAFCRTKGDERYHFCNAFGCALAQYLKGAGLWETDHLPCELEKICGIAWSPTDGTALARALNPGRAPQTFSALADRLEALIVDSPVVSVQA